MFVVRVWWRAIQRGTDIECYCVCCEVLGSVIYRGTNTECYWVCCECLWRGYREELILYVTVFVVSVCGREYREELIPNVTVFVVRVWWEAIKRGSDTKYYCVCCEGLGRAI